MTVKEYDELINDHIKKKNFVKIKRTVTEGSGDIMGFILKMTKDFLLIQMEEEFYLNGYAIIKQDHYDSIRCNESDKAVKKILKGEGIIGSDYGIKKKLRLKEWKTIFEDLLKHDYHVIIECEDLKEPLFLIGPIKKIKKDSVNIRYYNAQGVLNEKSTKVKYKDITIVKFDSRYINVFRKYLKTK